MLAQVIDKTGGSEVFQSVHLPIPTLTKGQVLIKVAATVRVFGLQSACLTFPTSSTCGSEG